mmetsp:Transcript_28958/g.87670  ORF Transcript_28958/g.87670 Transcript_28958/m.87670 type:complete len:347 (-) Transcript_28958:301-1341(-)
MGADAQLVEASARIAELEAEVAELKRNSQGPVPSTSLSKSLLAARAVFQVLLLAICLWGAIISTINYREAPSMKTSSMTPQLSTLKNAADDCPVAVHETKLVMQGGFLEIELQDVDGSEGRQRQNYTINAATSVATCRDALVIADNYENGVDHVVLPCRTCGGDKTYPLLSPTMLTEKEDHFIIRGHIGEPLNGDYEIKCCYPKSECVARPNLPCALAPVPEVGLPEHTCPDWEPEPEPEPYGRMLFAPDGRNAADAEVEKVPLFDLDVALLSDALSKNDECADKPDHLLAEEAERLSLPATSCADLLFLGACELKLVKKLCAKACGTCEGQDRHADRRRLGKCGS